MAAKRVVLVSVTTVLGGGEIYGTSLMAALDPDRYQATVLCPPTGDLPDLARARGLRVAPLTLPPYIMGAARASFSFGPRSLSAAGLATASAIGVMVQELRRAKAQVVHINAMKAGLIAAPAARLLGLPVVWDFKDLVSPDHYSSPLRRVVVAYLNLFATRVIANSGAIRTELIRAGVRADKVVALHNGIDLQRFSPQNAAAGRERVRPELGLASGALVVVMVGRLAPWKGHDIFIQAAARVHARLPEARFLIVGDSAFDPPAYRSRLERLAIDGGLGDSLSFLGFRDDVPDVMGAADIVVHCSTLPEPLGLTPIEAMALGVPVIAAAAGGPLETVADGETGLLTPRGDVQKLADAMLRLLRDARMREEMGAAGRRRATTLFDLHKNAKAVMGVYEEAIMRVHEKRRGGRDLPFTGSNDDAAAMMNTQTRILCYNHAPEISGAERSLLSILESAPASAYRMVLCAPHGALTDEALHRGIKTLSIAPASLGYTRDPLTFVRQAASAIAPALDLAGVIQQCRPDIVHANSIRSGLIAGLALHLVHPRPRLVVHLRDALRGALPDRFAAMFINREADMIVAISDYVARSVGLHGAKAHVLHNAIDPANYRFDAGKGRALRQSRGISDDAAVLAVVGQITPWKGQREAIEALALVRRRAPNTHLLIAGSIKFSGASRRYDNHAYYDELIVRSGQSDVAGFVHLLDEMPDVSRVYSAATALLVPSRGEPFGRIVIKAMAAECPVIGTAAGGIPEIISHGVNGLLVPPLHTQSLADAALRLCSDDSLRRTLIGNGMKTVVEHFSLQPYIVELGRLWEATYGISPSLRMSCGASVSGR